MIKTIFFSPKETFAMDLCYVPSLSIQGKLSHESTAKHLPLKRLHSFT